MGPAPLAETVNVAISSEAEGVSTVAVFGGGGSSGPSASGDPSGSEPPLVPPEGMRGDVSFRTVAVAAAVRHEELQRGEALPDARMKAKRLAEETREAYSQRVDFVRKLCLPVRSRAEVERARMSKAALPTVVPPIQELRAAQERFIEEVADWLSLAMCEKPSGPCPTQTHGSAVAGYLLMKTASGETLDPPVWQVRWSTASNMLGITKAPSGNRKISLKRAVFVGLSDYAIASAIAAKMGLEAPVQSAT